MNSDLASASRIVPERNRADGVEQGHGESHPHVWAQYLISPSVGTQSAGKTHAYISGSFPCLLPPSSPPARRHIPTNKILTLNE